MVETAKRCRINFKQTAKGAVQFDITADYETPEDSANAMSRAIDLARKTAAEKGLQLVGEIE